jgi:hypothetical protein
LAQRVEDGSGELTEFVEEQNAPMCKPDLSWSHGCTPASDQGDGRNPMMRRTERRAGHQPTTGPGFSRGRMDPGHVAGRGRVEVGQETRHAISQQGLARSWRPDEKQVMAAGRGRLESSAGHRLAEDIGQIAFGGIRLDRRVVTMLD